MKGSEGTDWMYGKGGADILKGFGNTPDWEEGLNGEGGNDKLYGGEGWDILTGGPGNDTLVGDDIGGHSTDAYQFEANSWGNDTITDTATVLHANGYPLANSLNFRTGITTNLFINLNA